LLFELQRLRTQCATPCRPSSWTKLREGPGRGVGENRGRGKRSGRKRKNSFKNQTSQIYLYII